MSINIQDFAGKRVHIIGISGASLCGLADLLQEQGYKVTGSDMKETIFTPFVRKCGVPFTIGHSEANVQGADLVVYSAAVPPTNVELAYARAHGIPTMERAELVGQLMRQYQTAIGVSGCHGKTTITSLIGLMLLKGGLDPTIHVGGVLEYLGEGGTRLGKGNTMVVEACEYVDSFLKFYPTIAVINNIDDDHLDYFTGGLEQVYQSYAKYAALLPENGLLVGCVDDENVKKLMDVCDRPHISYGLDKTADWTARDIEYDHFGRPTFTALHNGEAVCRVKLNIPGEYNIVNTLAAMAVATTLGCPVHAMEEAIAEYAAAERRFQFHGEVDGVRIYHDFAHHPSAVRACMKAASMFDYNKLWVVFQCNSYSRAYKLFDRFVEAFDPADCTIIAEIFPGREQDTGLVHGSQMAEAIRARGHESYYIPTFPEIGRFLHAHWQPGDMVLLVGSGDINAHVNEIMHPDQL